MICTRWVVLVSTMVLSLTSLAPQAQSDRPTSADKLFKVEWSSINYHKSVGIRNSKTSSPTTRGSENLSMYCDVQILDPNLVLGTGRLAVVTQLMDGAGREVSVPTRPPHQERYQRLDYSRHSLPQRVPRWRAILGSILHLPSNPRPQFVTELRSNPLEIELGSGLLEPPRSEIQSIKGYFLALVAESIEYVEVPFEPNDRWLSLTPDFQARVNKASYTETGYYCDIETRWLTQQSLDGLESIGVLLPDRVVVGQQFITADGKQAPPADARFYWPRPVNGESTAGGLADGHIKTIRFAIAVNPTHRRIPFELQHIPIPDPNLPVTSPKGKQ